MGIPSSNQYFEAIHTGPGTPASPNLFNGSEIVAGSFDSGAVSTATSAAVSTINAAAPDSTSISQARSQAVSAASMGSVADSKSVSNSINISVVDSKAASGSVNTSIADSKGASAAFFSSAPSAIVSTADSKAVSAGAIVPSPAEGRTVANLGAYVADQRLYNLLDYVPPGYVQGTTDATSAIQAMIDGAPDYSTLVIPGHSTAYKVTGAPLLTGTLGRKGLTFICWGATIQLSGVGAHALRFSTGQHDDIHVYGLRVVGSGVVSDDHQGFGTVVGVPAGTAGSNIRFHNCHVKDCVRGWHFESSDIIWRDVNFHGCRAENIVGTASGKGYGILVASILGVSITDCYFDLCQRHSVYDSNCQDISIIGNTFRRHRQGVATSATFSALVVTRRPNVNVIGNKFDTCSDTALEISSDESDVNQPIYNVNVLANEFHDSVFRDVEIGSQAAPTSGELSHVSFAFNTITRTEGAAVSIESLRIWNGLGVTIACNKWRMRNAYTISKAAIVVGVAAFAAALIDDLDLFENRLDTTITGGGHSNLIEVSSNMCGGTQSIRIINNRQKGSASDSCVIFDAANTNPNIEMRGNRANGQMTGTAVLVAGTVTVNTPEIRTGDVVRITRTVAGGALGHLSLGVITSTVSFVVNSSSGTDTSTVAWEILH